MSDDLMTEASDEEHDELAQDNFTELWALLQFLMSGANLASLGIGFRVRTFIRIFSGFFSHSFPDPLVKAIEVGTVMDDETLQRSYLRCTLSCVLTCFGA
jgi:hypothetical protein